MRLLCFQFRGVTSSISLCGSSGINVIFMPKNTRKKLGTQRNHREFYSVGV